jgi:hypothetical protein
MARTQLTPVIPLTRYQNPLVKEPGFNSLPQSKRTLWNPQRIQPLATVSPQGGGGAE